MTAMTKESRCYNSAWPCDTVTVLKLRIIILPSACDYATLRLIYMISLTSIARVAPLVCQHLALWLLTICKNK